MDKLKEFLSKEIEELNEKAEKATNDGYENFARFLLGKAMMAAKILSMIELGKFDE